MLPVIVATQHPRAVTWSRHSLGVRPARSARHLVRQWLTRHACAEHVIEAAELVVAELVANAVQHGGYPTALTLDIDHPTLHAEGVLLICVHDPGVEEPIAPGLNTQSLCGFHECGRGLSIVAALSQAWGVVRHQDRHKHVWCELPVPQGRVSAPA
ncbi:MULTISPECIES: ATP-binding protein [unclassified Streptomyces]|uniref:ATP-binding protein n=1 Tax=unclassified Streptomyces TaxID=2593676 RepID=UPI002153A2D3|nr:ATP-binding protein [Streptomyces sp. CB02959]